MSDIREYNYLKPSQRRLTGLNVFLSFAVSAFIFRYAFDVYSSIFPYQRVFEVLLACALLVHVAGFCAGKLIFSKIRHTRVLYILIELVFISLAAAFLNIGFFTDNLAASVLRNIAYHPLKHAAIVFLFPFFLGLKTNYFLRTSCGKYFDEKRGCVSFFGLFISGVIAGGLSYFFAAHSSVYISVFSSVILPLAITVFLIKLEYSPEKILARDHSSSPAVNQAPRVFFCRDDFAFRYLNVAYVAILIYMACVAVIGVHGDTAPVKYGFFAAAFAALFSGYLLFPLFRRLSGLFYAETVYPLLFMLFIVFVYSGGASFSLWKTALAFFPCAFLFGVAVRGSASSVDENHKQIKGHFISGISFFLLPAPLISFIALFPFSGKWFFILFYCVSACCFVFPLVYIFRDRVAGARKWVSFFLLAASAAVFVMAHWVYRIPVSQKLLVSRVSGVENISGAVAGSQYILDAANIKMGQAPLMQISEHSVRSLRRAVLASAVVCGTDSKTLILDGYGAFYRNPSFNIFSNAKSLSYFPGDFSMPGASGYSVRASLPVEKGELLIKLARSAGKSDVIVDIPNLYDQSKNDFRFSDTVFRLIKRNLSANGVYVAVLSSDARYLRCRSSAYSTIAKHFSNRMYFLTEDLVVVFASDSPDKLLLSQPALDRFSLITSSRDDEKTFYFDDAHFLSSFFSSEILSDGLAESASVPAKDRITQAVRSRYYLNQSIDEKIFGGDAKVFASVNDKFRRERDIISSLKDAERLEYASEFDREMEILFSLRRAADYNEALKQYVSYHLGVKEKTYIREAQVFESQKKWEEAKKVYRAILVVNQQNFDANYRMALISITLQEIDEAFKYLNIALAIEPYHGQVNYQMGVLMMSRGEYEKALSYLSRSLSAKGDESMTLFYAGYCCEKMGQLQNAENYYKQAYAVNPASNDIKSSLERIRNMLEDERNKWKPAELKSQRELEKDEVFPLPINESAQKQRLSDEDPEAAKRPAN